MRPATLKRHTNQLPRIFQQGGVHTSQQSAENMIIGRDALLAMQMAVLSGKQQRIAATHIQKIARGFLTRKSHSAAALAAHGPSNLHSSLAYLPPLPLTRQYHVFE